MLTFIATPILMAGVLVQAYRGFKAHKNNDIDAQNRFLKIIVMLACVQCIEGVTDFMSWFPGYSLVKLLFVVAVVFPTETTQRMLYDDRVVPAIFSTANVVSARLFTARAFAATELLRRTTAFSQWVLTETECIRYISDEELAILVDCTTAASQRVKSENTRRLRESLPSLAPVATTTTTASAPAAPVAAAAPLLTAPAAPAAAAAEPVDAVLRPQLRPSSKSSSIATIAPTPSALSLTTAAPPIPSRPAPSTTAAVPAPAGMSTATMGVFSVAESADADENNDDNDENIAPSRSRTGTTTAAAAGLTKTRPAATPASGGEADSFVPPRSVGLRSRIPRSRVSMM